MCYALFVWFARAALLAMLQPLCWRCVECVAHHEQDVREEKHILYIYVARTSHIRVIAARDLYCCLLPQCLCAHAARDFRSQQLESPRLQHEKHAASAKHLVNWAGLRLNARTRM